MSKFYLDTYPGADYDIWIAGLPYSQKPKKPLTLKQWAAQEGADIVYPLAMYNMQKGTSYGATIQFVRGKAGDIGYSGGNYVLGLNPLEMMYGANKAGGHVYACAGYKTAIVNGNIYPGLDKNSRRSRNCNGILKSGDYFHMVTEKGVTEQECAAYAQQQGAVFMLMQDGGGTTAKYMDGKVAFAPEGGRVTTNVICIKRKSKQQEGDIMNVICTKRTTVYDATGRLEPGRCIDKGDRCEIARVITWALLIEVTYPVTGGTHKAYIRSLESFRA